MSEMTAEVTELYPHARLFGQAAIQDDPGRWLSEQIEGLVKRARIESADEASKETYRTMGAFSAYKALVRDVCREYSESGELCHTEAEKIADRLGLEPWWGQAFLVTVPVTITCRVDVEDGSNLDKDVLADLLCIEISEATRKPLGFEIEDIDYSVETFDIDITEES